MSTHRIITMAATVLTGAALGLSALTTAGTAADGDGPQIATMRTSPSSPVKSSAFRL